MNTIVERLEQHFQALKNTELACSMLLGSGDVLAIITEMKAEKPVARFFVSYFRNNPSMRNTELQELGNLPVGAHSLFTYPQPQAKAKAVMLTHEEVAVLFAQETGFDMDTSEAAIIDFARSLEKTVFTRNNIEVME